MKLYTVPFAPNPTKVALYLAERAASGDPIELDQVIVNLLRGEQRSAEHLSRNPFGTLPVLELDDGSYLLESLSIIDYFEAQFPEGALLPKDVHARALIRDLERIIECRLGFSLFDFVHATKSPFGLAPDKEKAAGALEQMALPLNYLESILADGRPFLSGENISTPDISLGAYLFFARITGEDLLGDRSDLKQWYRRFVARPAARSVFEPAQR